MRSHCLIQARSCLDLTESSSRPNQNHHLQGPHRKVRSHLSNSELHLDLEIAQSGVPAKVQLPNSIRLAEDAMKRRVT